MLVKLTYLATWAFAVFSLTCCLVLCEEGSTLDERTKWRDVLSEMQQTDYMQLVGAEGLFKYHPQVQEIDQEIDSLNNRMDNDESNLEKFVDLARLYHRRSKILYFPHDTAYTFYVYEMVINYIKPDSSSETMDDWHGYCSILSEFGEKLYNSELFSHAYSVMKELDKYPHNYCKGVNQGVRTVVKLLSLSRLNRYEEMIKLYQDEIKGAEEKADSDVKQFCSYAIQELETAFGSNSTIFGDEVSLEWFKGELDECHSVISESISINEEQLKNYFQLELKRVFRGYFQYYEKRKDFQKAWEHLEHYHSPTESLKENDSDEYDPDVFSNLYNFVVSSFEEIVDSAIREKVQASESYAPIFIVGFPRSGSTLVESILGAHSYVGTMGESSMLENVAPHLIDILKENPDDQSIIDHLSNVSVPTLLYAMKERYKFILHKQAEHDDESSSISSSNKLRFVDKQLHNYLYCGLIDILFPNALIIHVARNPMDVLFGNHKKFFADSEMKYLTGFESLFKGYKTYRDIMTYWDKVLPGRIIHIRYEELVQDLSGIAKALINEANLPWEEGVLDFYKKKRAVHSASRAQVRKGIYTSSIDSWKRYEKYLEPLKDGIGSYIDYQLTTRIGDYVFTNLDDSLKEEL